MKDLIEKFKESPPRNVLVIGDLMLDEYLFGSVERISPEAPVPVIREKKREWSLGGAANVALNCKHIGCHVDLVGIVNASDIAGTRLVSMLDKNGISPIGIFKSLHRVTTSKRRVMSRNQQLLRIDLEDHKSLFYDERFALTEKFDRLLRLNSVIIVSDYAKGIVDVEIMRHILSKAKKFNCLVLADAKGPDFNKYKKVAFLKPNLKEFNQMVNFFNLPFDATILENGRKICDLLSLKGLIVTLGEKGIEFISSTEHIFSPAIGKKEVFDLTGAGDTVIAFLALGLLNKISMRKCLSLANHAASVAITHLKTYAVSLEEMIDKNLETTQKYFSDWRYLKIELDWLKVESKKIVLTNGCFDLLHSGHIQILKEAKRRGDILVVALNTDDSVSRIKGDGRPIKSLDDRIQVMSAIGFVDFIVAFDENTPARLIEFLKPDVLVKGGDYKKEEIVGYDILKSYGGVIEVVDHQFCHDKGYSSSKFIRKINNA